jgi:hypothetical protein
MDYDELRDDQWERLKDLVPGGRKGKRGPRSKKPAVSQRSSMDGALGGTMAWLARAAGGGAITAGSRWAFLRPCSKRSRAKPISTG